MNTSVIYHLLTYGVGWQLKYIVSARKHCSAMFFLKGSVLFNYSTVLWYAVGKGGTSPFTPILKTKRIGSYSLTWIRVIITNHVSIPPSPGRLTFVWLVSHWLQNQYWRWKTVLQLPLCAWKMPAGF